MIDLTKPMNESEIQKLDRFQKAQLFHNVYEKYSYDNLPQSLKEFYNIDNGLNAVKSLASTAGIQDPYTLVRFIKLVRPDTPKTYQHIYNRAKFLADMCDTDVLSILNSDFFKGFNFIPDMTYAGDKKVEATKGVGTYIPLKDGEYIPSEDEDEGGGSGQDYKDEEKVYFYYYASSDEIRASKTFAELKTKLPKLPESELVFAEDENNTNILNVSCNYNEEADKITFNFFQISETEMTLYRVEYTASDLTVSAGTFIMNGNG